MTPAAAKQRLEPALLKESLWAAFPKVCFCTHATRDLNGHATVIVILMRNTTEYAPHTHHRPALGKDGNHQQNSVSAMRQGFQYLILLRVQGFTMTLSRSMMLISLPTFMRRLAKAHQSGSLSGGKLASWFLSLQPRPVSCARKRLPAAGSLGLQHSLALNSFKLSPHSDAAQVHEGAFEPLGLSQHRQDAGTVMAVDQGLALQKTPTPSTLFSACRLCALFHNATAFHACAPAGQRRGPG